MNRCVIAIVVTILVAGCDPDGLGRSNPNFLIIGHRGAPNLACENTMVSFELAAAVGANAIETDFSVTSDREIVIWHDRDPDDAIALARQNGVEGLLCIPQVPLVGSGWRRPVDQLTYAQLREHYGYGPIDEPRDPTATIPTLTDLLRWFRSDPHDDADPTSPARRIRTLYLDLKLTPAQLDDAITILHMVVEDGEPAPRLADMTFYMLTVHSEIAGGLRDEVARIGAGNVRVVYEYEGAGALAGTRSLGLRDVSTGLVASRSWNGYKCELAELVDAREAGRIDSITAWTFDREMQLAELLYYSVDGVMTNEPAMLHRMWLDSLD